MVKRGVFIYQIANPKKFTDRWGVLKAKRQWLDIIVLVIGRSVQQQIYCLVTKIPDCRQIVRRVERINHYLIYSLPNWHSTFFSDLFQSKQLFHSYCSQILLKFLVKKSMKWKHLNTWNCLSIDMTNQLLKFREFWKSVCRKKIIDHGHHHAL